jgi:hypothetical protein
METFRPFTRRSYSDRPIDILFPGEQAECHFTFDETGQRHVTYFVYPMPGLRGFWLRLRFRFQLLREKWGMLG